MSADLIPPEKHKGYIYPNPKVGDIILSRYNTTIDLNNKVMGYSEQQPLYYIVLEKPRHHLVTTEGYVDWGDYILLNLQTGETEFKAICSIEIIEVVA